MCRQVHTRRARWALGVFRCQPQCPAFPSRAQHAGVGPAHIADCQTHTLTSASSAVQPPGSMRTTQPTQPLSRRPAASPTASAGLAEQQLSRCSSAPEYSTITAALVCSWLASPCKPENAEARFARRSCRCAVCFKCGADPAAHRRIYAADGGARRRSHCTSCKELPPFLSRWRSPSS